MRVFIVTPAARGTRNGNRNTAVRWGRLLRSVGHEVTLDTVWQGQPADVLIALHARRSHDSIVRFRHAFMNAPLIVALTGTDLYRDIRYDANAQASMRMADRMILLQEDGLRELSAALRRKCRVVYQSASPLARSRPLARAFEIAVVGHLREEKDPFRAALSARLLPEQSRVRIVHLGRALSASMHRQARRLMQTEPRYRWLGELPHWQVRKYLARAQALVISSIMEGGANVASEALAANLPVLASRISGNIGMLGRNYEGYFPVGDERALAALIHRLETDAGFRRRLKAQCAARRHLVSVDRERLALKHIVSDLVVEKRR